MTASTEHTLTSIAERRSALYSHLSDDQMWAFIDQLEVERNAPLYCLATPVYEQDAARDRLWDMVMEMDRRTTIQLGVTVDWVTGSASNAINALRDATNCFEVAA